MKKGFVIILTGIGMLIVLSVILLSNFNAEKFRVDIGHSFAEIVKANSISQNINIYVQDSAEMAFDRTSKDIGSRGGYALINSLDCDSVSYVSQNYVVWNSNNCFPNKETLEQNFAKAYLPAFNKLVNEFPTIDGTTFKKGYFSNKVFMDTAINFPEDAPITILGVPALLSDPEYEFDEVTQNLKITYTSRPDYLSLQGTEAYFEFQIYPFFQVTRDSTIIEDFASIGEWANNLNVQSCIDGTDCTEDAPYTTTYRTQTEGDDSYGLFDVSTIHGTMSFALKA
jgi:hypothetical protein